VPAGVGIAFFERADQHQHHFHEGFFGFSDFPQEAMCFDGS
jgi:hypothetical protein